MVPHSIHSVLDTSASTSSFHSSKWQWGSVAWHSKKWKCHHWTCDRRIRISFYFDFSYGFWLLAYRSKTHTDTRTHSLSIYIQIITSIWKFVIRERKTLAWLLAFDSNFLYLNTHTHTEKKHHTKPSRSDRIVPVCKKRKTNKIYRNSNKFFATASIYRCAMPLSHAEHKTPILNMSENMVVISNGIVQL